MDDPVEELQRHAAADPQVIGLGGGLPGESRFPRRALTRAFLTVLGRPGAPALQYGWPEGLEALRAWVAERLVGRGARVAASEVVITNGAQQALSLAAQLACLRGEPIGVDPETYPAALELFRERGLRPGPGAGARAHYALPAVSNPRGRGLGPAARRALLASGAPILEDDAYADLRFAGPAGPPLLAEARDRVWHVGTLSKTLCPGLRLGWLVPPPARLDDVLRLAHGRDLQPNSLAQAVAAEYLAGADWEARLARLRRHYRARAARLCEAVRRHLPGFRFEEPEGGFALWLEADAAADELALLREALAVGVSFDPGSTFRASGAAAPTAMRLCFSHAPVDLLEPGVRRLARAWRRAAR